MRLWKPDVLRGLPLDRPAVIEASAGTGKTFTIEHLVAELVLERGLELGQILVVTFTEKAATELKQRVRSTLARLRAGRGRRAQDDEPGWTIDDAARNRLDRALASFDSAAISTIHGFCQATLIENAFASGRLLVQEQAHADELFDRVFFRCLREDLAVDPACSRLLELLTATRGAAAVADGLRQAARAHGRPLRSWRPDVLEAAWARLVSLFRELDRDATEKVLKAAGRELWSDVRDLVTSGGEPDVLRLSLLLADAKPIGSEMQKKAQRAGAVGASIDAIETAQQAALGAEGLAHALLGPVVGERLVREKSERGLYDFDDMIALLRAAVLPVESGPSAAATPLCRSLRARFRFALIDEFQDTSEDQWDVFRTVFLDSDDGHVLQVVGDPKQAIYGFRGADIATYYAARAAILARRGELIRLDRNWRSGPRLVTATNEIFSAAAPAPFFCGQTTYEDPVEPGLGTMELRTPTGEPLPALRMLRYRPANPRGESAATLADRLARGLACAVHDLLCAGPMVCTDGETRPLHAADVFVLTHTNREARRIVAALEALEVPCSLYRQDDLLTGEEARDLRDVLAAVARPDDDGARLRAALTPIFGMRLAELAGWREFPADHPLLTRLARWHELARARDLDALVDDVVEGSGLIARLRYERPGRREASSYRRLGEILADAGRGCGGDLDALVRLLCLWITETVKPSGEGFGERPLETEDPAVQVMTMHKSKGLEAQAVFLYAPTAGGAPRSPHVFHHRGERVLHLGSISALDDDERGALKECRLEEDRRLLYVALTRAKSLLVLPDLTMEARGRRAPAFWTPVADRLTAMAETVFAREPQTYAAVDMLGDPELAWRVPVPPAWSPRDLDAEALRARELLSQRRPPRMESYSSMKRRAAARAAVPSGPADPRPGTDERDEGEAMPLDPDALPGGRATGLLLHDLLEHLDLAAAAACATPDDVVALDGVADRIDEGLRRYGLEARHRRAALTILHDTVRASADLGPGARLERIGACGEAARELEFLIPLPGPSTPSIASGWGDRVRIESGWLKGFIDLIFRHGDRVYIADWKSDVCASYLPEALAERVAADYVLQVRVYTLALVRILGLHDEHGFERAFGGVCYFFLRGLGPDRPGEGVYFTRPSWKDVMLWEAGLAEAFPHALEVDA